MAQLHHIVGGGFSGLLTAYLLRREGYEVELFEPGHLGGLIHSDRTPFGLVESAANAFLASKLLVQISGDLGLKFAVPKKTSKARYISAQNLSRWPLGFTGTLVALSKFVSAPLRGGRAPKELESFTDYCERVFGKAFASRVGRVIMQGIYGTSGDSLSASLILSRFFDGSFAEARKKRHPLVRGSISFPEGLGEFTQALASHLKEDPGFHLHTDRVSSEEIRAWSQNPSIAGVWIATDVGSATKLAEKIDPELSRALSKIEQLPIVTGTFFFDHKAEDRPGFGALRDPASETEPKALLGVLFNDQIFENRSLYRSETWILGGKEGQKILEFSDDQICAFVQQRRKEIFGVESETLFHRITRWPKALPHYSFELEKNQRLFAQDWGKVRLVGNYVAGIGLTRIAEHISERVESLKRN